MGSRHIGCYKEVLFYNKGDGNKKRVLGTVEAWPEKEKKQHIRKRVQSKGVTLNQ